MDHHGIARQALQWKPEGFRRPGRPNWKGVIKKDLGKMDVGWNEVEEAAENRIEERVEKCRLMRL